mgnify:CR=1 FL=1
MSGEYWNVISLKLDVYARVEWMLLQMIERCKVQGLTCYHYIIDLGRIKLIPEVYEMHGFTCHVGHNGDLWVSQETNKV